MITLSLFLLFSLVVSSFVGSTSTLEVFFMLVLLSVMSFIMALVFSSFFCAALFFLIYLGGLLVLFLYMIMLSSNMKFQYKIIPSLIIMVSGLVLLTVFYNINFYDYFFPLDPMNKMVSNIFIVLFLGTYLLVGLFSLLTLLFWSKTTLKIENSEV